MFGWFSFAAACASRLNEARNAVSCDTEAGSTLSATRRLSPAWIASYTVPIPPRPMSRVTR